MLSRFTIFKTRTPKSFEFAPRYFDPRKERLKEREEELKKEMRQNADPVISARLKEALGERRNHVREQRRRSSVRLVIIMAVLGLLAFLMYNQLGGIF